MTDQEIARFESLLDEAAEGWSKAIGEFWHPNERAAAYGQVREFCALAEKAIARLRASPAGRGDS